MTTSADAAPYTFPSDLLEAQRAFVGLRAELRALQARLPWSREPLDGWEPIEEHGRKHPGREASEGWTEQEAAENDRLWKKLREAAAAVSCHKHWEQFQGAEAIAARQALKRATLAPAGTLTPVDRAVTA
ncbi:hypothetical protein [Streptomyces sp. NPDC093223]|uniref:hypothetical protein n=1 Tax=Streptomyces sp. NPDC093223 TaxID=3366033 RepID=UPI003818EA7B